MAPPGKNSGPGEGHPFRAALDTASQAAQEGMSAQHVIDRVVRYLPTEAILKILEVLHPQGHGYRRPSSILLVEAVRAYQEQNPQAGELDLEA